MAKEDKTGEDVTGAADQNAGVNADAAGLQGTGDNLPAAGDAQLQAQVEAFKTAKEDEVAKRQAIEEQNRILQEQIALIQANAPQQTSQQIQDFFSQKGMRDDDFIQVGTIRQQQQDYAQKLMMALNYQNFLNQNPDYSEVVGTMDAKGRFNCAEPLKETMKQNPALHGLDNALMNFPSIAPIVYQLAKQVKQIKELNERVSASTEHQSQLEIAQKIAPMSSAAAGGGGAMPSESVIANASDDSFDELERKVKAGHFG